MTKKPIQNKKGKRREEGLVEFRKDIVCGDWVLISSARKNRPIFTAPQKIVKKKFDLKLCPFEDPQKSGNGAAIIWLPHPNNGKKHDPEDFKDWFLQVIENKYPVVNKEKVSFCEKEGQFRKCSGAGFHEVVITRDHNKPFEKMSIEEISLVLRTYQQRYKFFEKDERIEYILIYHNKGELAGASIAHPHSQIVALPIIPPDVSRSINGGLLYFEKNKKCVHCVMINQETKDKKRVIFENEDFITFAPYASKVPYEVRIFPKKHSSDFEEFPDEHIFHLAESLKDILLRMQKVLGEFDYNFFIHTSSARVDNVPYYHWHIEIFPRTYKWAGLELGTGIEINSTPPEEAAEELRNALKNKK